MNDLRERVAVAIMTAKAGPSIGETQRNMADAAIALIRAETLEEAAKVAEAFPAKTHGNLATAPYAAAEQATDEIAAAIRALKEKPLLSGDKHSRENGADNTGNPGI